MCRIFGNISRDGNLIEFEKFNQITLLSKNGGPDNTSYYTDNFAQLGFNRLAILDTSANGNQPIYSPSRRYIIMFNGEIYNYRDLAQEYGIKELRSTSDSEILSHLVERLSIEKLVTVLNGMFAISIWDTQEELLYLIRDFAGIKPLFYGFNDQGIVFASQFDQITGHPWYRHWSFDEQGIRDYHAFGYMVPPRTVVRQIHQLQLGSYLVYNRRNHHLQEYNYQRFFDVPGDPNLGETSPQVLAEAHEVLKKVVNHQLVSDVPLGVFLSSGIDSTLISAIASKIRPDIKTITIGFDEARFDESSKAAEYSRILRIDNRNEILSADEMLRIFSSHFDSLTEPFSDYSSLPTFLVSKVAAQYFKVMLSGDGGDELFWGYPRFATYANSGPFFNIPSVPLRKLAKRGLKLLGYDITTYLGLDNIGQVNEAFHHCVLPSQLRQIMPAISNAKDINDAFSFNSKKKIEILQYLRKNEFRYHLQKILVKVDRTSMYNSLEVRVPFLDKEVLSFAENIRPELTIKHQELKFLLRNLLYQYLPKDVIQKKKIGFSPPLVTWARTILKEEICDTISSRTHFPEDLYNQQKVNSLVADFMTGQHDNIQLVWTLYIFKKWYSVNYKIT